MPDSARWCMFCKAWGDHHTDRCPVTPDRDERLAEATRKTDEALAAIRDQRLAREEDR